MNQWEYKIIEYKTRLRSASFKVDDIPFETTRYNEIKGIFGTKKVKEKKAPLTANEMEGGLNYLGEQGWEMCGMIPLITTEGSFPGGSNTNRIYLIFKRRKEQKSV